MWKNGPRLYLKKTKAQSLPPFQADPGLNSSNSIPLGPPNSGPWNGLPKPLFCSHIDETLGDSNLFPYNGKNG